MAISCKGQPLTLTAPDPSHFLSDDQALEQLCRPGDESLRHATTPSLPSSTRIAVLGPPGCGRPALTAAALIQLGAGGAPVVSLAGLPTMLSRIGSRESRRLGRMLAEVSPKLRLIFIQG